MLRCGNILWSICSCFFSIFRNAISYKIKRWWTLLTDRYTSSRECRNGPLKFERLHLISPSCVDHVYHRIRYFKTNRFTRCITRFDRQKGSYRSTQMLSTENATFEKKKKEWASSIRSFQSIRVYRGRYRPAHKVGRGKWNLTIWLTSEPAGRSVAVCVTWDLFDARGQMSLQMTNISSKLSQYLQNLLKSIYLNIVTVQCAQFFFCLPTRIDGYSLHETPFYLFKDDLLIRRTSPNHAFVFSC